jgi:hypothetical protein
MLFFSCIDLKSLGEHAPLIPPLIQSGSVVYGVNIGITPAEKIAITQLKSSPRVSSAWV